MSRYIRYRWTAVAALCLAVALGACSGSGSDPTTTSQADSTDAAHGQALYEATCAACHAADARGVSGLGKDLVASELVATSTVQELAEFIKVGRGVDDPDNTTGVQMPPNGGNPNLDATDLEAIAFYLKTLNEGTTRPETTTTFPPDPDALVIDGYTFVPVTPPFAISTPVLVVTPPESDFTLVVERGGVVRILDGDDSLAGEPFLDISDQVGVEGEGGLVGLTFHPDYVENGRLFMHYTDLETNVRIVEMTVDAENPRIADIESERLILKAVQPAVEHNGGGLLFGPDGYLYIGLGDGGGYGDPHENAQNPATLPGSILRIDIDNGNPYASPDANAFFDGQLPEIWVMGVRNPYRITMDAELGILLIGDVGQDRAEEINAVPIAENGWNLGWPITEGFSCFPGVGIEDDVVFDCDREGLKDPIFEVLHDDKGAGHCAIILGPIYRGNALPELRGHLFFADLCSGLMESFRFDGTEITDRIDWRNATDQIEDAILGFGIGADGELYVATGNAGIIYRLVSSGSI